MPRRFAIVLVMAVLLLPARFAAADTYKLEIATVAPKKTPWAELLALYEANVEKASGGEYECAGADRGDPRATSRCPPQRRDHLVADRHGRLSDAGNDNRVRAIELSEVPRHPQVVRAGLDFAGLAANPHTVRLRVPRRGDVAENLAGNRQIERDDAVHRKNGHYAHDLNNISRHFLART